MKPEDLGLNEALEKYLLEYNLSGFEVGRVVTEHKERYIVRTAEAEFEAEITGHMRFTAKNREDFPAVGDWVAISPYDTGLAIIHAILPRSSVIKRQAVGSSGEVQVIATNIDYAFLVQAVDRDFNVNRLERYLTICHASKVQPVIVLTKTDLIASTRLEEIIQSIKSRIKDVPVLAVSNETQSGFTELQVFIRKGKTYCMLGSSGVGKSSLLNNLSGSAIMRTDAISRSTSKGRHITSHRELVILEHGGILIDNPGMREVGIADTTGGLETTFDAITRLAQECKYKDCTHTTEAGCAVLAAVETGEIDRASYENYLKMEREKAHFEATVAERRKKDKAFGKMIRNVKMGIRKREDQ